MNEDLGKKIKQITEMLGQEKGAENLMGLISMLAGPSGGQSGSDTAASKASGITPADTEKENRADPDDTMEMLRRVKSMMDRFNSASDPRLNLLSALRPFMGSRRQKKIGNCINILRIASVARMMEEQDKGNV